ncbi:MAG TPA: hypothetical protein VFM17_08600 [Candidatus Eisenbacteria bacterium]|nr:hypothetical protein [Candidatus Eisenbacteria bacterium]
MAVKVMLAPSIAARAIDKDVPGAKREAPAKPRRRRSSVYDADGNEVFITLMCLKCHKMRPLSLFGLRKMADGAIRNQPWCRTCRSGAGTRPAREDSTEIVDSPAPPPPPAAAEAANDARDPQRRPANPAAEVAAALSAGRR